MTDGGYMAQLLAAACFMIVGIRLLLLGRRTAEVPEKLLGAYFFAAGLSYLGWVLPTVSRLAAVTDQVELAAWSLYSIGVVPFLLFIRLVFRPDSAWANWTVGSCTLLLLAGMATSFAQGHPFYSVENPWFWSQWLGYAVPCIWVTVEAFVAYSGASRRVRVGLCDRVVANRYLLFGCFGAFQTFACITDVFETIDRLPAGVISAGFDLVLGTLELAGIVMLFLAFFPPAFYQRWISAPAVSTAGAVDG